MHISTQQHKKLTDIRVKYKYENFVGKHEHCDYINGQDRTQDLKLQSQHQSNVFNMDNVSFSATITGL